MNLADSLKGVDLSQPSRKGPLWTGPDGEGDNGGVTQGLLGKFLACRERFRLLVVDGYRPSEGFNHRLEFGNLWHTCEEALAKGDDPTRGGREDRKVGLWERHLQDYATNLCRRFPLQQEQVEHWYEVCRRQFPEYVKYWSAHPDVTNRTPLLQEQTFDVPYPLPSGRTVRLRGKWDSVDLIDQSFTKATHIKTEGSVATMRKGPKEIWLQENKSKGDINEAQLKRQLASGFELQTMLYLTALDADYNSPSGKAWQIGESILRGETGKVYPIAGVRYNVIRRPLSGGKGTIVRGKGTAGSKCPKCKGSGRVKSVHSPVDGIRCPKCNGAGKVGGKPPETKETYYDRMVEYIREAPETYFMRWNVTVTQQDITRFRRECLDPILEQMCDWWEWITYCTRKGHDPFVAKELTTETEMESRTDWMGKGLHWRTPYGLYSPVAEGGEDDLDAYANTGSTAGLSRVGTLFPELEEGA